MGSYDYGKDEVYRWIKKTFPLDASILDVGVEDAWHSFQCVRIPDAYARECAAWLHGDGRLKSEYPLWIRTGKMDDSVFRTYLLDMHARETVENLRPCLVEHVDWIIGGSILSP